MGIGDIYIMVGPSPSVAKTKLSILAIRKYKGLKKDRGLSLLCNTADFGGTLLHPPVKSVSLQCPPQQTSIKVAIAFFSDCKQGIIGTLRSSKSESEKSGRKSTRSSRSRSRACKDKLI